MPATITDYSVADILAQMLIDDTAVTGVSSINSLGVPSGEWPVYVNGEPDTDSNVPDEVVTIYDTGSGLNERSFVDGQNIGPSTFQVRVRGATRRIANSKASQLEKYLSERLDLVYRRGVSIGDRYYLIHAITNFSDLISLGQRIPDSRAWVVVFNAQATVTDQTP